MGRQRDCEGMSAVNILARIETRDSLVIAIAWLAYGAGAADDNVVRQRRTGTEISPRHWADEGGGGGVAIPGDELALRLGMHSIGQRSENGTRTTPLGRWRWWRSSRGLE